MSTEVAGRLNAALDGRYRIERELGEGGMATVYLAADLKHERKVALKVLKPELAAVVGADRFLAEIKTTANLQHPHILPLHDSGEADGFLYYVMPYVEGESLRDRLQREKQLPVDESVRIATDVAEALHAAHEQGVIHRDIKPANILLSRGRPLVADFGIALAVSAAGGGRLTETGLSMGTPFYMSPEQAAADREPSAASDVYSLACVLYEMLVGDPPHTASSAQAVLAKILTEDARTATSMRASIPVNVDAAIRKGLEKVPADRFTSAAGFATALSDTAFTHAAAAAPVEAAEAAARGAWNRVSVAATAAAFVFALVAAWGWLRPTPAPISAVPTRAPLTGVDMPDFGRRVAISPDGRWIAATGMADGQPQLFVRSASDTEWRALEGGELGTSPAFSPSADWVAFIVPGGGVRRAPVLGGPALDVAQGYDPHWGDNDSIVFVRPGTRELLIVAPDGGAPSVLFDPDSIIPTHPHLLPGGEGVLFSTMAGGDFSSSRIMLLERASGEVHEVQPSGTDPSYVATGHLVYGHGDQALMGVPFDLDELEVTGSTKLLLPALRVGGGGHAQFGVSLTGTAVYDRLTSSIVAERRLVEVSLDGVESPIGTVTGDLFIPRYAPDGARLAYEIQVEGATEIEIHDVESGVRQQFTTGGGSVPVWSADGNDIYYTAANQGLAYVRPADGRDVATPLFTGPEPMWLMDVSADGDQAVIMSIRERGYDLLRTTLPADGPSLADLFATEAWENHADLAPDGRWVVYSSDEDGEPRVYANSFPELTGRRPISPGYGVEAVWSPDGSTIFYRAGFAFYAVDVTTEPTLRVLSAPRLLFERPGYVARVGINYRNWDLHPDGDRFVMTAGTGDQIGESDAYIVTNWFEEVRRLMGN